MNNIFFTDEEFEVKSELVSFLQDPVSFFSEILGIEKGDDINNETYGFMVCSTLQSDNLFRGLLIDEFLDFSVFDKISNAYKNSEKIFNHKELSLVENIEKHTDIGLYISNHHKMVLGVYLYFLYKKGLVKSPIPTEVYISLEKDIDSELASFNKIDFHMSSKGNWSKTEKKYVDLCESVINKRISLLKAEHEHKLNYGI